MSVDIPFNQHHALLVKIESVFGTATTPSRDIGLVETFNFDETNNVTAIDASGSREIQELADGQYAGTLKSTMKYQHGRIFEYIFGGTTTHAVSSSDIKHTFAVGTEVDSMSLGHSYNLTTDQLRIFNGVKVNNLTVNYALGQPIRVTWDGLVKSVDNTTTALTAVISSIPTLKSYNSSLSLGTDGAEAAVGKLESFNCTFANQLTRVDGSSDRESQAICSDTLLITFEFTKAFDSIAEYTIFLGGATPATGDVTAKSLVFNANNGVSLGSGRREINIDMAVTKLATSGEAKVLRGKVMQTFKGNATTITDMFTVDDITEANWT